MNDNVDFEKQAKEMGWVPQDQWKGDPEKWTDAETFVERGEHVLPILRANNRRLQNDLLTRDEKIGTLQQQLDATKAIVQGLEKNFNESLDARLKEQRRQLKADLRTAVEDRDTDREFEVREQLDELTEAEKAAKLKQEENRKKLEGQKPTNPTNTDPNLSTDYNEWKRQNPWFGTDEYKKKTKAVIRAAEDLRDEGDTSQGVEFFNKALAIVEGEDKKDPPVSKVEPGNSRSSSRSSSGTYASLPAEAKKACAEDVENFVGEGKLFKTEKEWQDYYAKTFYGE